MSNLPSTTCDIASRLELFVDDFLIEQHSGTRLQLHEPRFADVALRFDKPWEGLFAAYTTVLQDADRYRLYYRGKAVDGIDGSGDEVTCYAESLDGIHWQRLETGLHELEGSLQNNVIMTRALSAGNLSVFIDTNPACPPEARYKGVTGLDPEGLFALASSDGIHWRRLVDGPVLTSEKFGFDSQNVPFWSASEDCYVLYFRSWKPHPDGEGTMGFRWISRSTSKDFLHWEEPVEMDMGETPFEHLYTNQTAPYFRAPHIYISLAARFWPGKRAISAAEESALGIDHLYSNDCSDPVLMTSRGGNRYDRTFLESFIRPGLGAGNWVSRTNYPGLGVIPTGPAEISMYLTREFGLSTSYLGRYVLRTDGFVSVNAPYSGGELLTKSLTFTGSELKINFATSAAGLIQVEIQDADGKPVSGYSLIDSLMIIGDEIDRTVTWKNGPDVSALAGRAVRLRFVMKDADLYSLQFVEAS